MPSWGEILGELQQSALVNNGLADVDGIRRKYLTELHRYRGRDTILYSTDWASATSGGGPQTSIGIEDMQGMMEVCRGLVGPELELILHSPGGSAEHTASIVRYLRRKFTHIRAFIPIAAMSAATMWALACDEIYMGKHSQLGPIDPQIVVPVPVGQTYILQQFPARAILRQFERAKSECAANPAVLGAWLPSLQQLGPALLDTCERAEALALGLVTEWLASYMFKGGGAKARAEKTATWFAEYGQTQSHALGIDRDQARVHKVVVRDLEDDQTLQDLVLSVHHATIHTFSGPAVKIIENHLQRAFVILQSAVPFPVGQFQQPQPQPSA